MSKFTSQKEIYDEIFEKQVSNLVSIMLSEIIDV